MRRHPLNLSLLFSVSDDYRAHTSCITEAERYEGKFVKKPIKRNPQQEWMDIVVSCQTSAPGPLASYMRTIAGLDNIPRKEKQFRNFTANSLNLRGKNGDAVVGEIWKLLVEERGRLLVEKEKKQQGKKVQHENDCEDKVEQGANEETSETTAVKAPLDEKNKKSSTPDLDPKQVHKAIKKALKEAPNRSMKLKELRRLLGDKLGLSKGARKLLKKLMQDSPDSTLKKSKVKVDGKLIMLV